MRHSHGTLLSFIAAALIMAPVTKAFLDEIALLREELQVYQTTRAANFSDLVSKLDEIAGLTFKDVADGSWYYKYVASVGNWGIVSGYFDDKGQRTGFFGPQNPVTVAESLKMAFKAARVDQSLCGSLPPAHPGTQGHWAASFVSCAEKMGVRLLERNEYVDLNRPVTRAEALAIIDDVFGEEVPGVYADFEDTKGHEYEADVAYGVMRGIVSGDADAEGNSLGTFRPDDSVNRAEMSKLIYEQLKSDVGSDQPQVPSEQG